MRLILTLVLMLWPMVGDAQTRSVTPAQLHLSVSVEKTAHTPFVREMVLLTIRGEYRRHITRETLRQPDFTGFSWTQLGPDTWREERINGERVKTMTRRMAIYPDRAGALTIGAFSHDLTLTDENDTWFAHQIQSEPVTILVAPPPSGVTWWFPAKNLKILDQWSNPPEQLKPGEGVLRVIRLEALGVTPEMIPPMPVLTSPSGMIFAHPDQRMVELSPEGPVTYAFWRWTIQPGNDTSAIVEPLSFEFYNTQTRAAQTVTISAQRVAYGAAVPEAGPAVMPPAPVRLPSWPMGVMAALIFAGGIGLGLGGWRPTGARALTRFAMFDPLKWRLRQAARHDDLAAVRRLAAGLLARDGPNPQRARLLSELDGQIFNPGAVPGPLPAFAHRFLKSRAG
jgi:hypothetical protein